MITSSIIAGLLWQIRNNVIHVHLNNFLCIGCVVFFDALLYAIIFKRNSVVFRELAYVFGYFSFASTRIYLVF